MPDRPAYSCGALDCCTGGHFPECQENFSLGDPSTVHIPVVPSHYEDEQTSASPHTFTD